MSNVNKTNETVKTEGTQVVDNAATQQQVIAQGTPAPEQKKGWFATHIADPIKRNKKVILAGLGGVAAGAAGTVAYGYFAGKAAEKRAAREQVYIPQQEDVNPLDPNV